MYLREWIEWTGAYPLIALLTGAFLLVSGSSLVGVIVGVVVGVVAGLAALAVLVLVSLAVGGPRGPVASVVYFLTEASGQGPKWFLAGPALATVLATIAVARAIG